jgi:hypothetical protein
VERKLLQIALASVALVGFGFAGVFFGANFLDMSGNGVMDSSLAGELIAALLLWLWQRRVAGAAQRRALT